MNKHAAALGRLTSPAKAEAARQNGKRGGRPRVERSWRRWYEDARYEMSFRHGMRGVPVDAYKTQFALGSDVHAACKNIAETFRVYGVYPF